jgi:ribonucleoside-triphosphate reductase (thioredoxin)
MFLTENRGSLYVEDRFELDGSVIQALRAYPPTFGFDGFGEVVYYRTYSREAFGKQERWLDTVVRVVNGVFSIRKDWYRRRGVRWDEGKWQATAASMAYAVYRMHFLPPGRGLYAMGTDHVYRVGAMPLFNCGATTTRSAHFADELGWIMDALMCGVGVGAEVTHEPLHLQSPGPPVRFSVADSREGWVDSVVWLVNAYVYGGPKPRFDYSPIRKAGTKLRGIGGVASGPKPLEDLHLMMEATLEMALRADISNLRLRADLVNQIGACVSMGDVRRSSEMLIGPAGDPEFLALKDYERNPMRSPWGWASNNSIAVDEFSQIQMVAADVANARGEKPGVLNRALLRKRGDKATLVNPCGEIPLEPRELCNVVETFPERCIADGGFRAFDEALELAALYAHTVSLLPTHSESTNRVLHRNRRIGVSISGISALFDGEFKGNADSLRAWLRPRRMLVEEKAIEYAVEARVLAPIRVTTIKPGGTVPLLAGTQGGMSWPVDEYAIRRIRVGAHVPIRKLFDAAGLGSEVDPDSGAMVYSFPIHSPGRVERDVPLRDQGELLFALSDAWADNAVSCTLKYSAQEAPDLQDFLEDAIPDVPSLSVAALADLEGNYALPPYQRIDREEYERLKSSQPKIDWKAYAADGSDAPYCDGGTCAL